MWGGETEGREIPVSKIPGAEHEHMNMGIMWHEVHQMTWLFVSL